MGCLDATDGRPMWTTDLGLSQTGRVWAEQGAAGVMALWDQGKLCGLDTETGRIVWTQDFPLIALSQDRHSVRPGVVLGDVLVGWGEGGRLTRWSPDGHEILWAVDLSQALGLGGRRPRADELAPLCLCGGVLVTQVGAYGNRALVGVDPETGSVRRRRTTTRDLTLDAPGRRRAGVPVLAGDTGFSEVDPADGTLRWTLPMPCHLAGGVLCVSAGHMGVVRDDGVTVVHRETGRVATQTPTREPGEYTHDQPGVALMEKDGRLRVYVIAGGALAAYEVGR